MRIRRAYNHPSPPPPSILNKNSPIPPWENLKEFLNVGRGMFGEFYSKF